MKQFRSLRPVDRESSEHNYRYRYPRGLGTDADGYVSLLFKEYVTNNRTGSLLALD